MRSRHFLIGALLLLGWNYDALGEPLNHAKALKAYSQALQKAIDAREALLLTHNISYIEVNRNQTDKPKNIAKTIGFNAEGEEIQLGLFDSQANEDELSWQFNVLVNPKRFPDIAELIDETETTWVFKVPTQVVANLEGTDQEDESSTVNRTLSEALSSELTVSKREPRLLFLKTYAKEAFKPSTLAEVTEFNVRIEYAEAWDGGPLIAKALSRIVKGSYAVFFSADEFSQVLHRDFKLIKAGKSHEN